LKEQKKLNINISKRQTAQSILRLLDVWTVEHNKWNLGFTLKGNKLRFPRNYFENSAGCMA
jgi:hypothetical protein